MSPRKLLEAVVLTLLWLAAPVLGETYVFAVVPQFTPEEIHRHWRPVLDELGRRTGNEFRLKIHASIPEFERSFLQGEPDFAYLNPYHAVMAKRAQGFEPLLQDGSRKFTGLLVVRKDSPIKSLQELNGKEIAFPAPNAFGASLYMRALLGERENLRFTPRFLGTHSNVFRHVIIGNVAAGGAVAHTLASERGEVRDQLRVLYETPVTASHPVVFHPRAGKAAAIAVRKAFLAMADDPKWQSLLNDIQLGQPVAASYRDDYAGLEKLGLEKYLVNPDKPDKKP